MFTIGFMVWQLWALGGVPDSHCSPCGFFVFDGILLCASYPWWRKLITKSDWK